MALLSVLSVLLFILADPAPQSWEILTHVRSTGHCYGLGSPLRTRWPLMGAKMQVMEVSLPSPADALC